MFQELRQAATISVRLLRGLAKRRTQAHPCAANRRATHIRLLGFWARAPIPTSVGQCTATIETGRKGCAWCGKINSIECDTCDVAVCVQCLKSVARSATTQASSNPALDRHEGASAYETPAKSQHQSTTRSRNSSLEVSDTTDDSLREIGAAVEVAAAPKKKQRKKEGKAGRQTQWPLPIPARDHPSVDTRA